MTHHTKLRLWLVSTVAATALAGPTLAQTADSAVDAVLPSEVGEIIVTGARLQNRKAIAERRGNLQVTDAVTSDDVGRLPDFNIGEALMRLPGVAVQNDQGEARFVTVRALNANYNYTLVDGVSVAVPDRSGRRVFMDVMPASLADRIEVYKTFTPDMEGGAIGGVIDIRTASAFERPRETLELSAEIGRYELDKGFEGSGPSGTLDASYSTTFGAADQFGVVLFANYYQRDSYSPQAEYGGSRYFYTSAGVSAGQPGADTGVYPGTGFAVPGERRWYTYHNDRTRYGGGLKLEYRPTVNDYLFARGFWNTATDDEARQTDLLTHKGASVVNQTATSGEVRTGSGLSIQENLGQFEFERTVWAVTGGGDHQRFGGDLSWRLNYSGSHFENPEKWTEWRQNGNGAAFAYEQAGDHYVFTPLNPTAFNDYAAYAPYRRQFDERELNEDIFEAKMDYGRDLAGVGAGWRFKVGAGVREIDRDFDENRDRYLPNAGNTFTMLAADVVRDDLCLRAPGAGAGQCMVVIDPAAATAAWGAHFAANPAQWRYDAMASNDNNLDYSLKETVWHGYGLLAYTGDRWNMSVGARYENTETEGLGRRQVAGAWSTTENKGGYDDILPSINVSYHLRDDVVLRGAYSKSLGRVPFDAIAPVGESLTEDGTNVTLSRSNPDLLPRRADNFDLALDWYFGGGRGLLSASVFHKKVKNEFFTAASTMMIDLDGRQVEATVTQPMNAGSPVDINGVELNLIRELDFILPPVLKGFTVSANLTLLDTNFKQQMDDGSEVELKTMIGQPNIVYNLALSYDQGPISARLAYNYMGERMSERVNTASAYRNRYDGEDRSLDFKLRYAVSDRLSALFTASNITGEGRTEWMGWNQELPVVAADYGAAYFVGFSYRY